MKWFEKIDYLRKSRKIKRKDLLAPFKVKTEGAIGHYLKGIRTPEPYQLVSVASHFGMSLDYLMDESIDLSKDCIDGEVIRPAPSVTVPIESPPITTTFDIPINLKLEICKNMTPSTIELAYNTKSNNLVTAIYRLMNIGKEQDRLKVLLEIDDLIQAEIDMEKYVLEPATPKPKTPA
jgi:transcriptional regulator with XRE-family HTH domain